MSLLRRRRFHAQECLQQLLSKQHRLYLPGRCEGKSVVLIIGLELSTLSQKRAPPKAYVQSLENRLEKMEMLLRKVSILYGSLNV